MINRLQRLPQGPRIVIFSFMVIGGVLLLGGLTLALLVLTLNSSPRQTARALVETVTIAQFAALPGDDAFPSTVDVGPDGAVYTASYSTGALWSLSPDARTITEIPNTRDTFDSVSALAVRPDNTLLVVAYTGGEAGAWAVHSVTPGGQIALFGAPNDAQGFVSPFDIALDPDGAAYVVDRARAEIWRWPSPGAAPELWWSLLTTPIDSASPEGGPTPAPLGRPAPTGIAYDPSTDTLVVTDPDSNTIVRIPRDRSAAQIVFRSLDTRFPPGLDGIVVAPDGTLYVTALDQKGLARVSSPTELTYISGGFRGPSDLAFTPDGRLIVANFDSAALVQPGIRPQLPFALDILTFQ